MFSWHDKLNLRCFQSHKESFVTALTFHFETLSLPFRNKLNVIKRTRRKEDNQSNQFLYALG